MNLLVRKLVGLDGAHLDRVTTITQIISTAIGRNKLKMHTRNV
jgi:hypothetical protein